MLEKIKIIRYPIWGIVSLLGLICGMTPFLRYNFFIFPVIGAITFCFFPRTYLKWILKLLAVNFVVTVPVIFIRTETQLIESLLVALVYTGIYMILSTLGMLIVYLFRNLIRQEGSTLKRTLSGIGASLIVVMGLQFATELLGNPFVAMRARSEIAEYVALNHGEESFVIGPVTYDWHRSHYISRVRHQNEIDHHFTVAYRSQEGIVESSYEVDVLKFRNTVKRLSEEYSHLVRQLLDEELTLVNNRSEVWYDIDSIEMNPDVLYLGMAFDATLPLPVEVVLRFDLEEESLEAVADTLTQSHALFKANGFYFDAYSVFATAPGVEIEVLQVLPRDIEGNNVQTILERALEEGDYFEISIYRR